ncbi:lamin tail domain-containing protein [uncultured Mameliella sp.]|uniref:lamin tail domain-containing protein n=1 Tax=uncultured Mameliella sp. TaxID=1447087 RepID=UPI002628B7AE|nr:lamin tail domain-containing protein [uncultured Mameliella sp.]
MALIIGQVAITAAGKVAVELRNTGATAVDLTGWNVTVVNNSSGRGFLRSGGTMSPGGFYIVGHSCIPGLNATPSDLFPGLSPAKNRGQEYCALLPRSKSVRPFRLQK